MPNLIDKLIGKVDTVRQKAADRFGLPAHNMFRVLRQWDGGEIGAGNATDTVTAITPTPKIEFGGGADVLSNFGRDDKRAMKASEVSLTFTESFLRGLPAVAGQECFYKLVERNGQGAETTYWQLIKIPLVHRDEVEWVLEFGPYTVCS